eukprot:10751572-Alexandrium_andersonii.AAC.1
MTAQHGQDTAKRCVTTALNVGAKGALDPAVIYVDKVLAAWLKKAWADPDLLRRAVGAWVKA